MTPEFQQELIQFLAQAKAGKKYIKILDSAIFEKPEMQLVFDIFSKYVEEYGGVPSLASSLEYFRLEAKKSKVKPEAAAVIEKAIRRAYTPLTENTGLIREEILNYSKRAETKQLFLNNIEAVKEGDEDFFQKLYKKMGKIALRTEDSLDEDKNRGGLLLADRADHKFDRVEGCPTFLKGLNKLTAAKGFYSPQLIVLMGAPKAFKTGLMLKIAMEYVRDGYKVYYADTENSVNAIRTRARQSILECTRAELMQDENAKLAEDMMRQYGVMGGELVIDYFPANKSSLGDVEVNLEYYRDERAFVPDIIFYDYLDNFVPEDITIQKKDKRFQIQDIYHHSIRINHKWDTFAFTVSTVNRDAVNKAVINMKHFGEDFAKAYNCHAAFALCRTPDEVELGMGRLVPVAQRDGEAFTGSNACYLEIDEARMFIAEKDLTEINKKLKKRKDLTDD
jgi:hypothetical protein